MDFEILEFTLNININTQNQNIKTKGNLFSNEKLNQLKKLLVGSKFNINNISVIGLDSVQRIIKDITYIIE